MGVTDVKTHAWSRDRYFRVSADRMTVYHLRDFVKTLEKARIPDKTYVTCHKAVDTGHFNGLSVSITDYLDGAETADE